MAADETLSDAALLRRIRDGNLEAMGVMYQRHKEAALRVAMATSGDPHLAQDLVSTAFERIHAALGRGHGPQESFRAYLYTVIRRLAADVGQARAREVDVDDWAPYSAGTALADQTDGSIESRLVATAFVALPERHQAVLWYLDVEGMTPAQAAPLFDLTPNAVSALAIRARDGLRDAYVQAHVSDSPVHAECAPVRRLLGGHARGSLSTRDTVKVEAHLAMCDECPAVVAELRDVSGGLRTAFGPIIIGTATAGGLAAASATGVGASAAHAAAAPPVPDGGSAGGTIAGVVEKVVIGAVAVLAAVAIGSAIVNVSTLPATDLAAVAAAPAADPVVRVTPPPATTSTATAAPTPTPSPTPVPAPPVVPPPVPPAAPSQPDPATPVTPAPVPPEAALFLDVIDDGDAGLGDGTRLNRIFVDVTNTTRSPIDATLRLRLPGGMQVDSSRSIDGGASWACPTPTAVPVECLAEDIAAGDTVHLEVPVRTPAADVDSRPVANLRITNS